MYLRLMQYGYTGTGPTVTVRTPTGRTLIALTGTTTRTLVAAATTVGTATRVDAVGETIVDCGTYSLNAGELITNDNGNSTLLEAALSAGSIQCQTMLYLVKQ